MLSRRLPALLRVTRSRASVAPYLCPRSSFLSLFNCTPIRAMSVFNSSRLLGKTVLITGASAGIGAVRLSVPSFSRCTD